jgi:BioD-like phosphotransacetylase family protein
VRGFKDLSIFSASCLNQFHTPVGNSSLDRALSHFKKLKGANVMCTYADRENFVVGASQNQCNFYDIRTAVSGIYDNWDWKPTVK